MLSLMNSATTYTDSHGKQVTETARVSTGHYAADYGKTVHVYNEENQLAMVYSGSERREKASGQYGVRWI